MFDSLRSDGTAILAIRTPPGVMKPVSKSSRRPPPRRGSAAQALTALREVQYHRNATLRGHEENCWACEVGRKPLSDFTVADDAAGTGGAHANSLNRRTEIIFTPSE